MKMLKYLIKKIFICLSLALIFLVAASFVASSVGDQEKDKIGVALYQDPKGPVTKGKYITFSWDVIQPGSYYYPGNYSFKIERPPPNKEIKVIYSIRDTDNFSDFYNWTIPDDEPEGAHTAYIKVPYEETPEKPPIGAYAEFNVVPTVLVIQKHQDINLNGQIDEKDKRPGGCKFNVINPDGVPSTIPTDDNGEIRIEVPEKYGDQYRFGAQKI